MPNHSCFTEAPGRLARAATILLCPWAAGCSLLYQHSVSGRAFTLYSDKSPDFLEGAAAQLERMYEGYGGIFGVPFDRLGRTSIVLDGRDDGVLDYGYSPSVLGYYVPFFNYICIDTRPPSTRSGEMLEQVLLHEVAHHFVVTTYPGGDPECWLNEGLAGALEVSVFDAVRFECPLFNPLLFQIAHHAAFARRDSVSLRGLLSMDWSSFHDPDSKERNYALAWAAVYYVLERRCPPGVPLQERIRMLYRIDRKELANDEPAWLAFLRGFDAGRRLLDLAASTDPAQLLTARWATRQLGAITSSDDLVVLEGLAALFDDPDGPKREDAYASFVQKLEKSSQSYVLSSDVVRAGIRRVGAVLEDRSAPSSLREALAQALGGSIHTRDLWLPSLIEVLATGDAGVRAAAARTLTRIGSKPTIVSPVFWVNGSPVERAREVEEWRDWLRTEPATAAFRDLAPAGSARL